MEHDDCHLDSFSSSIIQYLNEVLIEKNCVLSTFRKHSVKNDDFEFSYLLKRRFDSNCDDNRPFNQIESISFTAEEVERLKTISNSWCLHISNIFLKESKLCLNLDKSHTFSVIIRAILLQKSNYGKNFDKKQSIKVTSDEVNLLDLTEYRLSILKTSLENILKSAGYSVIKTDGDIWIHCTTKHLPPKKNEENSYKEIFCGAVINANNKTKETQINTENYKRQCLTELKAMAKNKSCESIDKDLLDVLQDSSLKISLLQRKSSQTVTLNFNTQNSTFRNTGGKGGVFLQYNASRLAAIRKKYEKLASDGVYPKIPNPEELNFGVLKEKEEWILLFDFLLEYPSLLHRLTHDMVQGVCNIHQLCDFMTKMCLLFSTYYRRVRILLEPREHLLPTIHGRLLLIMSVEQVLENCLNLFNIKKIEEM